MFNDKYKCKKKVNFSMLYMYFECHLQVEHTQCVWFSLQRVKHIIYALK